MRLTSKSAAVHLQNLLVASTPGGIEQQEAEGQRQMVASQVVPREIVNATASQLVALGFVFGEIVDDLFIKCDLPEGWVIEMTGHSMHSKIKDEKGRERVSIFYKAAFYDRRADMRMVQRFDISPYVKIDEQTYRCVVEDAGVTVFDAGVYAHRDFDAHDRLMAECKAWLNTRYPKWGDPLAYWEAA